jgi:predicted house-cleaning noncanonical NTP pyrophosphatase (MazG superfamily)
VTNHDYSKARVYNKLVRDKLPEIIAATGKPFTSHIATDAEYQEKLRQKLREELAEYLASGEAIDLADILEVIYALAEVGGLDQAALERERQRKATERGGFSKRIILEES